MKSILMTFLFLTAHTLLANDIVIDGKQYSLKKDGIYETDTSSGETKTLEHSDQFRKIVNYRGKLVGLDKWGNIKILHEEWEEIGDMATSIAVADNKLYKIHRNGSLSVIEKDSPRQKISGYLHNDGSIHYDFTAMKTVVDMNGNDTIVTTFATSTLYKNQFESTDFKNATDLVEKDGESYILFKSGAVVKLDNLKKNVATYFEIESSFFGWFKSCYEKDLFTRGKDFSKEYEMKVCEDKLVSDGRERKDVDNSKRTPYKEIDDPKYNHGSPQSLSK